MQDNPTDPGSALAAGRCLPHLSTDDDWLHKFGQVEHDYVSGPYGPVPPGYSPKPFGKRDAPGDLLFTLIDNARIVVINCVPALERGVSQVPHIIGRLSVKVRTIIDLGCDDPEIAAILSADRRLPVIDTVAKS